MADLPAKLNCLILNAAPTISNPDAGKSNDGAKAKACLDAAKYVALGGNAPGRIRKFGFSPIFRKANISR